MIDRRVRSFDQAVADVQDGATVLIGGFGSCGYPVSLMEALIKRGSRDLTIVANNAGEGRTEGIAGLMSNGQVRKMICSYPRTAGSVVFQELFRAGKIELELVPQGTISERLRCAGAGLGGFWSPVGVGTKLAEGKETRQIDGRDYVLEQPLHADFAFVRAHRADRLGNLVYRKSARNFNPVMAMAARVAIAEVDEIVPLGALDPEAIVTPGIFVQRVVELPR